jgi:AcrR family transcriptional regulator
VTATRPRAAGPFLDKATLVRAAADVADRDGWSQLTLSRVAETVDRHVSSLYTHVDGLDDLRREVALLAIDELAEEVWRAALGRSGGDALAAIATVERDYSRHHRGRIAAINAFTGSRDAEFRARGARLAEPIRATLAGFGLDADRIAVAHHVFSAAVLGLVQTEVHTSAGQAEADEALRQTVALFVAALESGDWPRPPEPRAGR